MTRFGQALTAIKFNLDMMDKTFLRHFSIVRERLGEAKSLSNQTLDSHAPVIDGPQAHHAR